jgi:hypothetical protein
MKSIILPVAMLLVLIVTLLLLAHVVHSAEFIRSECLDCYLPIQRY